MTAAVPDPVLGAVYVKLTEGVAEPPTACAVLSVPPPVTDAVTVCPFNGVVGSVAYTVAVTVVDAPALSVTAPLPVVALGVGVFSTKPWAASPAVGTTVVVDPLT